MTTEPTRDRTKELVVPKAGRKQSTVCALCGRPVGQSHEAYSRYRYCSRDCHRAARRINAVENKKRRQVAPILAEITQIDTPQPAEQRCYRCAAVKPAADFYRDKSRKAGIVNICKLCSMDKWREYYKEHSEQIKPRCAAAARERRASPEPEKPKGASAEQSAAWLNHAKANLAGIVRAIPRAAAEVLLKAIQNGRINGMVFEDKTGCGCIWGTIGRACGWSIEEEGAAAKKHRGRGCAEVEIFARIGPGDLPESNAYSHIAAAVIRQTLDETRSK